MVIVIDVSDSMNSEFEGGSKVKTAIYIADKLLQELNYRDKVFSIRTNFCRPSSRAANSNLNLVFAAELELAKSKLKNSNSFCKFSLNSNSLINSFEFAAAPSKTIL